jgi:vancomycin permeability regulator SanA
MEVAPSGVTPTGDAAPGPITRLRGLQVRWAKARRRWWVAAAALVALGLGPAVVVWGSTWTTAHGSAASTPPRPVAIVLGAGVGADGRPSPFLDERIGVAVQLYRQGSVKALLMSGDNSRTDYDEVGAMAVRAEQLGVPASAIVTDHAGFDTYSSCYRARSVWGITAAVVVSQPFHVGRAVWLCQRLGVDAVGAQTVSDREPVTYSGLAARDPGDRQVGDRRRPRSHPDVSRTA